VNQSGHEKNRQKLQKSLDEVGSGGHFPPSCWFTSIRSLITEVGSVVRQAGQKICHLGIDERLIGATVRPPFPSGKPLSVL
jgi:hypothetical protein